MCDRSQEFWGRWAFKARICLFFLPATSWYFFTFPFDFKKIFLNGFWRLLKRCGRRQEGKQHGSTTSFKRGVDKNTAGGSKRAKEDIQSRADICHSQLLSGNGSCLQKKCLEAKGPSLCAQVMVTMTTLPQWSLGASLQLLCAKSGLLGRMIWDLYHAFSQAQHSFLTKSWVLQGLVKIRSCP